MAAISTAKLIEKFQYALEHKFGYILGTWHTYWTQALQNAEIQIMIKQYGADWKNKGKGNSHYYNALNGGKWVNHYVTDCSGLFYWAFKELGGYMYHGSNTMWNKYCTNKGKLVNGKRSDGKELLPGTAVFVLKGTSDRSHVGLYIGGNQVIEASGQTSGVIMSSITNSKWAEWGELKGVEYPVTKKEETSASSIGSAVVNNTKVALREYPSTKAAVLIRVDQGERVQLLPENSEWQRVSYQGKTGYMMKKFLTE